MAELRGLTGFKVTIMIMLFYGIAITIIAYTIPAGAVDYAFALSEGVSDSALDYNTIAGDVQDSLESQKNIPIIDVGALVFYSGNILLDLFLNFLTAIPQLFTVLINSIALLFGAGLDVTLLALIESFATAAITIFYALQVMEVLLSVRSGRVI